MSTEIAPGVADRGVTIVACLAEGRWEEARRDFNAKMSEALDARVAVRSCSRGMRRLNRARA